ncbi:MAG TPA: PTS system mannose/fructose/sorbose family transporter subunit IID [Candidatus Limnocylindria bacterium]|nr:PTS system mannose/fructose/sorbose family transporter subunit IID [Candidatus Limnocylindria bacterium]
MGDMDSGVKLERSDVVRSFWLWTFFSHANYNYERLQGTAFAHAMTPIIRRLYKDPEQIKAALKRHLVFFNTEPNVGGVIHGAVIAMEEQRANGAEIDDDAINSVKSGLMGPLAGVGDTISQGTITPILLSIGISMAAAGNILGPILYFVLEIGIMLSMAYFFWMQGYDRGRDGVTSLLRSGLLDKVVTGASVLGNMVLGALTYQFVHVFVTFTVTIDQSNFELYKLLNSILPGLLPLAFIVLTWWLVTARRVSPILLLGIYLVVAMVGAYPIFGEVACPSILNPFFQPDYCVPAPPAV